MAYERIIWQNGEAGNTPLNANNLNKMDAAIEMLDSKASDSDYSINTINAKLTQQDAAINGKMDKSNPSASGTLSVPQISVGKLSNYGGYDVTLPATVQIEDEQGRPSSILGAFNYIRDVAFPKISENEQAIGEINNKLSGLGNEYLAKVNPMAQGTLVVDSTSPSSSGQILINSGQGSAGTVISSGLVSTLLGNFAFDIDLGTSSDYTDEPVLKVGKTINEMKKDINSLKKNVGTVVLADKSPLPACSASNILGISAKGKSEQKYGKELITRPYADSNKTVGTTTFTVNNDGSITVSTSNGTADTFATFAISYGTIAKGSFLSGCPSGGSETGYEFNVINNNGYVVRDYGSGAIAEQDYTSSTVRITIHTNAKFNSITFRPSMKPTIPTPTSPIPIVDASGEVVTIGENLWGEINLESGSLSSSDGSETTSTVYTRTKFIPLYGNATITLFADNWIRYFFYSESKAFISTASAQPLNGLVVNVPSNAKYIRAHINYPIASVGEHNIMIAYGSKTEYVPYQSNSITLPTLKSIDDEEDKLIVNEDGSGQIKRNVISKSFNGAENWTTRTTASGWKLYELDNAFSGASTSHPSGSALVISNQYSANVNLDSNNTIRILNGGKITLRDDSVADLATFKSRMASSNLVVYCDLSAPIFKDLTPEEVASIRQLMTYKGTTIIDSEMQIDSVTYSGDVKGYVDGFHTYSTVPTICGYEEDGTPIYRVKINANSISGTIITFPSNYKIKSLNGMIYRDNVTLPINCYVNQDTNVATYVNNLNLIMQVTSNFANKPCEIEVEYTLNDTASASVMSLSLDEETEA